MATFLRYSANYANVIEDTHTPATKMYSPMNLVLGNDIQRHSQKFLRTNSLQRSTLCVKR